MLTALDGECIEERCQNVGILFRGRLEGFWFYFVKFYVEYWLGGGGPCSVLNRTYPSFAEQSLFLAWFQADIPLALVCVRPVSENTTQAPGQDGGLRGPGTIW